MAFKRVDASTERDTGLRLEEWRRLAMIQSQCTAKRAHSLTRRSLTMEAIMMAPLPPNTSTSYTTRNAVL